MKRNLKGSSYRWKGSNPPQIALTSFSTATAANGLTTGFKFWDIITFFEKMGGIKAIIGSLESVTKAIVSVKEMTPMIKNIVGYIAGRKENSADVTDVDEMPDKEYLLLPRRRPKKRRRNRKVTSTRKQRMTKPISYSKNKRSRPTKK